MSPLRRRMIENMTGWIQVVVATLDEGWCDGGSAAFGSGSSG